MQHNKGLQRALRLLRPGLLPPFLALITGRETHVVELGHHLPQLPNIPPSSFSPSPLPSIPPPKPFTPLHYTNKANQPSGWCSHGPGRTCQQREINGLHQRSGAAHKPPQHRAREIKLLLPYIFHDIIHYCSVHACGSCTGCF